MNTHWTGRSIEDFVYRISSDFALQIENKMDEEGVTQSSLADTLGVTDGRVSQVLRNPGNLTLKKMVQYARSLGMKVSVVAYEDGDPQNENGPINSQIFSTCWTKAGKPTDFFALHESAPTILSVADIRYATRRRAIDESQTTDTRLLAGLVWQDAKRTTPSPLIEAGAH
jgi:transcriptional regulator with XRE-family HTH domain